MSKTITRQKNIASFQDVANETNEDEQTNYVKLMINEIDELNNKLNEERNNNDKNEAYILTLEEDLTNIYNKYKKLKEDINYLENYKELNKMTNEKIKNTIKEKIGGFKSENKYNKMNMEELRKIANDRLKSLKNKLNVVE